MVAGGVPVFATPSTMAQIMPHSTQYRLDSKPPGFRVVELFDGPHCHAAAERGGGGGGRGGGTDNAMRTRIVRLPAPVVSEDGGSSPGRPGAKL